MRRRHDERRGPKTEGAFLNAENLQIGVKGAAFFQHLVKAVVNGFVSGDVNQAERPGHHRREVENVNGGLVVEHHLRLPVNDEDAFPQ